MRLRLKKRKPRVGKEEPLSMWPPLRFASIDDYNKWTKTSDERYSVPASIKKGKTFIENPAYAAAQFELKYIWSTPATYIEKGKRKTRVK